MTTTTIRMSPDLKKRVARAAKRAGTTAHGFILDAIAQKAAEDELRSEFHDVADERYAGIAESGKAIGWEQVRGYLEKRAAGKPARRPIARKSSRRG